MRGRWFLLIAGLLAAAFAISATACGKDSRGGAEATATQPARNATATPTEQANGSTGTAVDVSLLEYAIAPDPNSVAAGPVTFNANNIGGEKHEMVIVKTNLAADALPTLDDGSVDESQVESVGEVADLAAGDSGSVTVNLAAGNYVLICNIVEEMAQGELHVHYQQGMRAAFAVTE